MARVQGCCQAWGCLDPKLSPTFDFHSAQRPGPSWRWGQPGSVGSPWRWVGPEVRGQLEIVGSARSQPKVNLEMGSVRDHTVRVRGQPEDEVSQGSARGQPADESARSHPGDEVRGQPGDGSTRGQPGISQRSVRGQPGLSPLPAGSLIQVPMSEKGKIPRGRLGSLSLRKEGERQCFLFSKHLIICTRGSGGKLHLTKVGGAWAGSCP